MQVDEEVVVSEEEEEAEDLEVDEVEVVSVGAVEVDSEVVAAVVVVAGVVDSEAAEGSVEVTKATLTLLRNATNAAFILHAYGNCTLLLEAVDFRLALIRVE